MQEGLKINIGADVSGLEQGVNKASQSLTKLRTPAAGAQNAITNLSRVASDAPFGFIAIQNNIDPLVESFQRLKAQSGSTGGALKALFSALAGPAGLALGVSIVSSLVVTLIQKYGSLDKALVELSSSSEVAAVRQRELAKAIDDAVAGTEGEVQTVQNLVRALIDSNNAQNVRTAAYETLRKIQPGLIQDLTLENALTAEGSDLIAQRSLQLIEYIKLKGKEAALIKLVETETQKQFETGRAGLELVKNQGTALNFLINSLVGGGNATAGLVGRQKSLTKEYEAAGEASGFYATQLEEVQKQILGIDTKITGITKVSTPKVSTPKAVKSGGGAIPLPVQLVPDRATVSQDPDREILRNFGIENGIQVPVNLTVPTDTFEDLQRIGEAARQAFEIQEIMRQSMELKRLFEDGLTMPLGTLIFDFLDKGKVGFKDFADAAIQAIKRIVAQLIASKIIQLLGDILFPATTVAGAGAIQAGGGFFGGLFGRTAAPSFGGISGGGGLSGQVVFVQRGSDLVGVLSRTNNRINRVG